MEYKTPKVLEKKPVVAGYELKVILVMTMSLLLFLFTIFKSVLLSLFFLGLGIGYLKIQRKYPNRGELATFLKFRTATHCVREHQPLRTLLKRRTLGENENLI